MNENDGSLSLDQLVEDDLFADFFGVTALALENGRGPQIWLAGDPEDLPTWLEMGTAGIVTNTVVLNEMVRKYGQLTDVVMRYLDITDKPVVMEIDGHSTGELIDVGHFFSEMSDQIMLKIPCYPHALEAFRHFSEDGIETFCTTVFSLNQAAAVASAGVDHILPFCEPVKEMGGDPTQLIRECAAMFKQWQRRPLIMAALVRSAETTYMALRDGADEVVIFWPVFQEMLQHSLTDTWNETFANEWRAIYDAGLMEGVPVRF